jgi:hypothetical protein
MNTRFSAVVVFVVAAGTCFGQPGRKVDSHQLAMKAHPMDRALQAEHAELLDLLDPEKATCTAIRDGSWSDPRIWKEGAVPGDDARVLILDGTTVTLDDFSRANLRWLRIDGVLEFAPDKKTGLVVDTLVVSPTGHLKIGTAEKPVASDKKAEIVFTGRGPIDTSWDPHQLSRGLISHGGVEIFGAEVTPYVTLARPPKAGDTRLFLNDRPTNWKRGDRLVLAATHPPERQMDAGKRYAGTSKVVYADNNQPDKSAKPMKKEAKPFNPNSASRKNPKGDLINPKGTKPPQASEDEELTILEINGREVTVRPLAHDHTAPADGLSVYLANTSRNVVLRSEKTAPLSSRGHAMFMHSPRVRIANAGFYDLGRTNKLEPVDDFEVMGKKGVQAGTGLNPRGRYAVHFHRTGSDIHSQPIGVRGCAVVNSPGWGFVNHSSFVEFDDNVAFNVDGSAFVTEAGDEVGAFRGNLAVRSIGSGEDPGERDPIQDFGHEGNGFWFQGGGLIVENNVASSCGHAGFFYFTRGLVQSGLGRMAFSTANLQDASWAKGQKFVSVGEVPIRSFKGNVAYAAHIGYAVRFQHTGSSKFGGPHNPGRSVLEDGLVWNTRYGVRIEYSERLTLRNLRLIGNTHGKGSIAGVMGANEGLEGMRYENLYVEGWEKGINVEQSSDHVIQGGFYNNFMNIYVPMPLTRNRVVDVEGDVRFGTLSDGVLGDRRQYDIFMDGDFGQLLQGDYRGRDPNMLFVPIVTKVATVRYQGKQIYYLEQAADHIPFSEAASGSVPKELIGKTNQEMWNRYGLAIGGALPPADARQEPRIHGLVGGPRSYARDLYANRVNSEQLRDCLVALVDQRKRVAASTKANLHPGWNLVSLAVDGALRSVLVYGGDGIRYNKKTGYSPQGDKQGSPPPAVDKRKKYGAPDRSGSP